MASPELTALSIANSPEQNQPSILDAGKAAADRIAQAKQLRDGGMSSANARRTVRGVEPTVSATQLAENVTPITVPEPEVETVPANLLGSAEQTLGNIRSQSERAQALAENERAIGSFMEGETAINLNQRMLEEFGVTPDVIQQRGEIGNQLANLLAASDLKKLDITSGGQGAAQGLRSLNQQDRETAVFAKQLEAQAAVLDGQINLGRQLAGDAVNLMLADRDFQYKNLIRQNQALSSQVDEETRQLLLAENRTYEEKLAEDQRYKASVDEAIATGAATNDEIASLTAPLPTHPDPATQEQLQNQAIKERQALAQSITARGAGEMRDLDIAQKRSGIAANYASIDLAERKFQYQQQQDALTAELEALQQAGEITEEQAANQKKVESALRLQDLTEQIRGHAGFNLSVGSVGSRVVSVSEGGIAGQVFNYLSGQGQGFDALYDQLTESLTLDNLDKMSGVLTDRDIQVLRSAATRLRKTTTEAEFLNTLDEMDSIFQRTVDENGITPQQARFYYGVDDEALSEIDSIYGTTSNTTQSSNINFDY